MRLRAVEIAGFRAFARYHRVDLDADAVIVVGSNGQGKTSLFDAVLWAITGKVPRLKGGDERVVSMYSLSGEARVALDLALNGREALRIVRSSDGSEQQLSATLGDDVLRGRSASLAILRTVWPEAQSSSNPEDSLAQALTRSVYLQQDLVRQFLEADTDVERFRAVSEICGAGRITELQAELDRSKRAWSRATNERDREGQASRERLAALEHEIARLADLTFDQNERAEIRSVWAEWWAKAGSLGVALADVPEPESVAAAAAIDQALRQLEPLRLAIERRQLAAAQLLDETQAHLEEPIDLEPLRQAAAEARTAVSSAREALAAAEARAVEARRAQVELREGSEELRALAQLALRHLGENCPVCDQQIDRGATQARLEQLAGAAGLSIEEPGDVPVAASELAARERDQIFADEDLRQAERLLQQRELWRVERDQRLHDLGMEADDSETMISAVRSRAAELAGQSEAIVELRRDGERLGLRLARAGELARRDELETVISSTRSEVAALDEWVRNRSETGDLAGAILDGLREAAQEVVREQLREIEVLLQRVYSTADPHPSFRVARLLTRLSRGQGRLDTAVEDPVADIASQAPPVVLSSSQTNALAVAVFIALNLGAPEVPLDVAMLDDPLQSLDDVNLLGLVDLLRRMKEKRQILLSTHDTRFGELLARKLRPVGAGQRTRVVEVEGWTREGPVLRQSAVNADPTKLRIVA